MANRADKSGRHIIAFFPIFTDQTLFLDSNYARPALYYLNIPVLLYFLGFKDKGKHGQKKPFECKGVFFHVDTRCRSSMH